MKENPSNPPSESGYIMDVARRAANYTPIERRNQLSKLCWFASDENMETK